MRKGWFALSPLKPCMWINRGLALADNQQRFRKTPAAYGSYMAEERIAAWLGAMDGTAQSSKG